MGERRDVCCGEGWGVSILDGGGREGGEGRGGNGLGGGRKREEA